MADDFLSGQPLPIPDLEIKSRLAPQHLLLLAASLGLLGLGGLLWLYLQAPYLGLTLEAAESGVRITQVAAGHPNHGRVPPGAHPLALVDPSGSKTIALQASDLVDEPDTLVSPGALSEFLNRQKMLHGMVSGDVVTAVVGSERVQLAVGRRGLYEVPAAYWLQSLAGWLCLVIGTAVLVFQRAGSSATRYFFTAGIAIYIAAAGGAVYAARELVLPPAIFHFVLLVNHLGTVLIVACLMGLIWNYPYQLARRGLLIVVFVLAAAALLAEQTDVGDVGAWLLYLYCSSGFFLGALLAVFQWRRTRGDPVNRAAMRWFLLAMVVGVVTPSTLIVVPALFGAGLAATHEVIFLSLLIMYLGVALGISRYRLFDLDVWWFRAWGWFLGGLSILLVDVLLIGLFDLESATALTIAVAAVGWIYFPVRQWLLQRLLRADAQPLERAMNLLVDALSGAHDADAIQARWPDILRQTFAALEVRQHQHATHKIRLSEHGTVMQLPPLAGEPGLEVAHPKGGSRLFSRDDLRLAELLLGLMRRATAEIRAREAGAEAERQRIRRDMHDDLGARLLDMTHNLPDEASREMARDATGRLRGILSAMDATPRALGRALSELQDECVARLQAAGIALDWQAPADTSTQISPRQYVNLGGIVREAVSNIIRHAHAEAVRIAFDLNKTETGPCLAVHISDDGCGLQSAPAQRGGLGLAGMRTRIEELDGRMDIHDMPDGGLGLRLIIPLAGAGQGRDAS